MNRRDFLLRSVSALAATRFATPSATAAESVGNPGGQLRLSTSSVHFKDLPIEQACERIAALGFEGIDIWCAYDNCPHLDDALTRLGPAALAELLARHRLKLYAFSTYVGGYAKYAALLGKAGGGVAVQGSGSPCPPEDLTRRMKAFLEEQKPLLDLAAQHNSYLAVENHGQALLDSLDSFKAFTDLNDSPRLGIALAPYHLQASGARVEDAIRVAGRQLFFFYAWQKQDGLGQLPGHGPTDFGPWMKALREVNYRWFVNPFMHGHVEPDAMTAALAKSRDYLKKLAAA